MGQSEVPVQSLQHGTLKNHVMNLMFLVLQLG
jgi:hypothetical protein